MDTIKHNNDSDFIYDISESITESSINSAIGDCALISDLTDRITNIEKVVYKKSEITNNSGNATNLKSIKLNRYVVIKVFGTVGNPSFKYRFIDLKNDKDYKFMFKNPPIIEIIQSFDSFYQSYNFYINLISKER